MTSRCDVTRGTYHQNGPYFGLLKYFYLSRHIWKFGKPLKHGDIIRNRIGNATSHMICWFWNRGIDMHWSTNIWQTMRINRFSLGVLPGGYRNQQHCWASMIAVIAGIMSNINQYHIHVYNNMETIYYRNYDWTMIVIVLWLDDNCRDCCDCIWRGS